MKKNILEILNDVDILEFENTKVLCGFLKGTNIIKHVIYGKINTQIIKHYCLSLYSLNNCLKVCIKITFDSYIKRFIFILNKLNKIIRIEPVPLYMEKKGKIVNIEFNANEIYLEYIIDIDSSNNLTEKFLQIGSGWLAEPIFGWKIENISYKNFTGLDVYFGNLGKYSDNFYKVSNIAAIFTNSSSSILYVNNGIIKFENSDHLDLLNYKNHIESMIIFYKRLFDIEPNFHLISCNTIDANCLSYSNLILVKSDILKNKVFIHKYLFHEMIHQIIGNYIEIIGPGNLWIKESFTEVLQLLYIKKRYGDKVFYDNIQYYAKIYKKYMDYEIPLTEAVDGINCSSYKATIVGKGILLLILIFQEINFDMDVIKTIIRLIMNQINKKLNLCDFIAILDDNLTNTKWSEFKIYLSKVGLPKNDLLKDMGERI